VESVHGDQPALLRVLGPIELEVHRSPVRLSDLERGVLASAAFRSLIGGDELAEWLWGESPPVSARNRIQALVSTIRRKAGGFPVLVTDGRGYRLSPAVCVDHALWRASVTRARNLRPLDPAGSIASYDEAVQLFDDPPLQGAPRTPKADLERDRLEQERLQVVEERLTTRLDSGSHDGIVSEAATLSGEHPYHEGFLSLYILALAATGQQRQALEVYRSSRGRLGDELGIEPSAQLRAAHQRVLRGDVPECRSVRAVDSDAETSQHAAPTVVDTAPAVLPVPQTLPRAPAGFVGRATELGQLIEAAEQARDHPVVVSLTGLTGIGKSALAAEAGARLRGHFPDGSLYADLSAAFAEGGVHAEVGNFLRLLGVLPEAIPDDPRARGGLYRSLIGDRRVLVVLDNVDSRDGRADPHLQDLLPTAPGSMAVITSRSPVDRLDPTLRLRVGALSEDEAVRLLENCAGIDRISAEPEAVRELVRQTSALPLALRLVGGRLAQRPDLTARGLARRLAGTARGLGVLDEAGTEESSLRTSLTMVWDRLPEQTRLTVGLLTQLPVDTFSAWVPQALLGDDSAGECAMNSLVDASFVEPVILPNRHAQYRLHDLVARFARERFEPSDEQRLAAVTAVATALLDLLARYHATFPLQFLPLPPLGGASREADDFGADEAHELLLTELATARGCARYLAGHSPGLAWRLLVACENAHHASAEKESWSAAVETVVACLDPVRDDDRLGAAILSVCRAWHLQDDLSQYNAALTMAVNARRELTLLGALPHAMAAGLVAANAAVALSDRDTADAELKLMADTALRPEARVLTGWRHIVQGELHNDYDELPESEAELTRAREVLDHTGERIGYAFATAYLSRACRRQGKLGPARILADEALEEFAHFGAEHAYTVALDARAEVGVELGHGDDALEQATSARSRAVAAHDEFMTARATRTRARALRVLGHLDEAADELRHSVDMFAAIDRTLSVAATLHDLAIVQDLMAEPGAASESLRQERSALQRARLERHDVLREQTR
jgi:DNA-binding SARP family transcriptional activator